MGKGTVFVVVKPIHNQKHPLAMRRDPTKPDTYKSFVDLKRAGKIRDENPTGGEPSANRIRGEDGRRALEQQHLRRNQEYFFRYYGNAEENSLDSI